MVRCVLWPDALAIPRRTDGTERTAVGARVLVQVRAELGRLRQITFMLNVGAVREAFGLLMSNLGSPPGGDGGTGGRVDNSGGSGGGLTREDAVRVLSLRVEFDGSDVRDLLLAE